MIEFLKKIREMLASLGDNGCVEFSLPKGIAGLEIGVHFGPVNNRYQMELAIPFVHIDMAREEAVDGYVNDWCNEVLKLSRAANDGVKLHPDGPAIATQFPNG